MGDLGALYLLRRNTASKQENAVNKIESHSLIYVVRAVNNGALYISLVCTWIIRQSKENIYTYYELLM